MTQDAAQKNEKKPRIVRVVSDDTLEAWEKQRAEYLAQHPAEASKPIKDELVREALGLPEEQIEETREKTGEKPESPEEKAKETKNATEEEEKEKEETEEEAAEKARAEDEENEDETDVEEEENEETESKEEEAEEEKEGEEESRVEVEKPVEPEKKTREEKRKPKIRVITEPVIKKDDAGKAKPRLIQEFEEQAARDATPYSPRPGIPITLEQASREVRVEEARRIWLQREQEKKKKLGFLGKIKAVLGFH